MKKIPIADATAAQLRYHAETVLGLELNRIANGPQIRAKIDAAAPGTTEITVEDAPESLAQTTAERNTAEKEVQTAADKVVGAEKQAVALQGMSAKQAAAHHNDPTIEIMIPPGAEAGGDRDVPVAVNGIQFLIKRDVWTPVPYRVFEALLNAAEIKYTHTNSDIGRMQVHERHVPSYPFQTRNGPSEAELAAWHERVENVELA
jgi:hypothetical protein